MKTDEAVQLVTKKNVHSVFRKLYIKRRKLNADGGGFESDWQQIDTDRVISWGSVEYSSNDIKLNYYSQSGVEVTVSNIDGLFTNNTDSRSFFNGYLPMYGSLIKVEAGYYDSAGTEYPTNPSIFIGILDNNYTSRASAEVKLSSSNLLSVFDREPVEQISNLIDADTYSAATMMSLIKAHSDGSGNPIFQQYISSGGFNINYNTNKNKYGTITSDYAGGKTVFQFMKDLAECENYTMYMDRTGDLTIDTIGASNLDSWHFSGINDKNKTYGHNVIDLIDRVQPTQKIYPWVRINYSGGSSEKQIPFTWGDSSSAYIYGYRKYELTLPLDGNGSVAATLSNALYAEYRNPKTEYVIATKYIPHLVPLQPCTLTYKQNVGSAGAAALWDTGLWDCFLWDVGTAGTIYGEKINNVSCKIIGIKHDLDNFRSIFRLREV